MGDNEWLAELERECPALIQAIGTDRTKSDALHELLNYLEWLEEQSIVGDLD